MPWSDAAVVLERQGREYGFGDMFLSVQPRVTTQLHLLDREELVGFTTNNIELRHLVAFDKRSVVAKFHNIKFSAKVLRNHCTLLLICIYSNQGWERFQWFCKAFEYSREELGNGIKTFSIVKFCIKLTRGKQSQYS